MFSHPHAPHSPNTLAYRDIPNILAKYPYWIVHWQGTSTNQCLTLVALQISSPQVYHGCAPTIEESHNKASLQALQKLASLTQNHAEQSRDSQSSTGKLPVSSDVGLRVLILQSPVHLRPKYFHAYCRAGFDSDGLTATETVTKNDLYYRWNFYNSYARYTLHRSCLPV